MTSDKFHSLFKGGPRTSESELTQKDMDIAASIQKVTEKIVLHIADYAHLVSGKSNLCLAGGVALNCVANGRIRSEGKFDSIWIQPAAGDAGGAIGAALAVWYMHLGNQRQVSVGNDSMKGCFLGPSPTDEGVKLSPKN